MITSTLLVYPERSIPSNQFATCFEDAIATLASWNFVGYRLMYLNTWCFQYNKTGVSLNDLFSVSSQDQHKIKDNLYHVYGITFTENHATKANEIIGAIQDNLRLGQPTMTRYDSYYSPRDKGYQKQHNNHICVVVGIHNDMVRVLDPYYEVSEVLSIEDFKLASGVYYSFNYEKREIAPDPSSLLKKAMIHSFFKESNFSAADYMKIFAHDFKYNWDFNAYFTNANDFSGTKLYRLIKNTLLNRVRFKSLLTDMIQHHGFHELIDFTEHFNNIIMNWNVIFSRTSKHYLTNTLDSGKHAISAKIIETANIEEELAAVLFNLLSHDAL
ncbi:BtrH N-terminal domain-containing protein [Paenibacillus sp. GCM10012307]|uniref:Butirosin biosynthesis protein H N-terminal domain-containing protein n=1 Tax=Paenibacillus roseus TaxID=2798579 RepID=A0A934J1K2_9BACL|nr:BtrH N-terminal domain-containing protein [Paenibacillus roseus]MBJ6361604.1 hypothetical protein [Paenibacillus roseus]